MRSGKENRPPNQQSKSIKESHFNLAPIIKKKETREKNFKSEQRDGLDLDLFNSLLKDNKRGESDSDHEREYQRPHARKTSLAPRSKVESYHSDKFKLLEEDLYAEQCKSEMLEVEISELNTKIDRDKADYMKKSEALLEQIRTTKLYGEELVKLRDSQQQLLDEKEVMNRELAKYKEICKSSLEFIVKCFEMVTLLPEQIEVDANSNEVVEFSFDEKRPPAQFMSKFVYLEKKIIKFLESKGQVFHTFDIEGLLLKVIDEYEKKKRTMKSKDSFQSNQKSNSPKSKYRTSPNTRSRRSASKKVEHSWNTEQSGFESINYDQTLDKNNSINRSIQSNGANNYSININLVVNDNSDSALSDNNLSGQGGSGIGGKSLPQSNGQQNVQQFMKFFEKELGCEGNKSESSMILADSLIYSPVDGSHSQRSMIGDTQRSAKKQSSICKSNVSADQYSDENSDTYSKIENSEERYTPILPEASTDLDVVVAKYTFKKAQPSDIDLHAGDKIRVFKKEKNGWWVGQNLKTTEYGMFPSNFVVPCNEGA